MSPEEITQLLPDPEHSRVRALLVDSWEEESGGIVRLRIGGVVDGLWTAAFLSVPPGIDPESLAPLMIEALLAQYAADCSPAAEDQAARELSSD
jgi:hypothetical protein